jgi:hypothetical protein
MKLLTLLCAGAFVFAGPALANPCEHNGNGSPPFCDDEPGPPGPPGHGHGHGQHGPIGVDVDVDVANTNTNTNTAVSSAYAGANSDSSATATGGDAMLIDESVVVQEIVVNGAEINVAGAEVEAGQSVIVEGDRVEAMEADDLPGIPASVFVDACGNGVAAGFPGGSASFGAGNPVCLWLAIGRAAHDLGDRERSDRALGEAEASLRRQRYVSRYLEGVPLIGRLF